MKKFSENCFGLTEQIKVGRFEYNISKQRSYFVSYSLINYFASKMCLLYCSLFYRIQTSHLLTSNLYTKDN